MDTSKIENQNGCKNVIVVWSSKEVLEEFNLWEIDSLKPLFNDVSSKVEYPILENDLKTNKLDDYYLDVKCSHGKKYEFFSENVVSGLDDDSEELEVFFENHPDIAITFCGINTETGWGSSGVFQILDGDIDSFSEEFEINGLTENDVKNHFEHITEESDPMTWEMLPAGIVQSYLQDEMCEYVKNNS